MGDVTAAFCTLGLSFSTVVQIVAIYWSTDLVASVIVACLSLHIVYLHPDGFSRLIDRERK